MTQNDQLEGMPPEPPPQPKIYVSGTPRPEKPIGKFGVNDKVLLTVRADVRAIGEQHQEDGKGPFIRFGCFEVVDVRPL